MQEQAKQTTAANSHNQVTISCEFNARYSKIEINDCNLNNILVLRQWETQTEVENFSLLK